MDFLGAGTAWLDGVLTAAVSRPVRYSRGPDSVVLDATFGSQLLRLDDGAGGARVVRTDADFTFPAADLVLGGARTTPRPGDLVAVDRPGGTVYYAVLPYADEPEWRYCDPGGLRVRVHTKVVHTEAPC